MFKWTFAAAMIAAGAAATGAGAETTMFIHGPKGCGFFDGLGGDGAAFHALDDDHTILDYYMIESGPESCQLDAAFDLRAAPGSVQIHSGRCENHATLKQFAGLFKLTFLDGGRAEVEFDGRRLIFEPCERS